MSPFFDKSPIDDTNPLIDDKDAPIAMSYALIVDRKPPIVESNRRLQENNYKETIKTKN